MSGFALMSPPTVRAGTLRDAMSRLEPILGATGLALLLSLALTVPAYWLDERLFQGQPVWLKPIKFQLALIIYTLTLAWYARWLPAGFLDRPVARLWLQLAVLAIAAEMVWITGAAMFASPSHYATGGVMGLIYPVMGLVAIQLTSLSLVFGVAIWRNRDSGLSPAVHLSLALGLVLTFVLTIMAVIPLASLPGHFVGTPVSGATVPLMGWSREVGDLRVAHFLATHALHAMPLAGLAVAGLMRPALAQRAVWLAAGLYAAVTLATLAQALAGQPLFP